MVRAAAASQPQQSDFRDYFYLTLVLCVGILITLGLFFTAFYMEYRTERRNMQVTNVNFTSAIEYMATNQILRLQNLEQEIFYAGQRQRNDLMSERFQGWVRTGFARYAGLIRMEGLRAFQPRRFDSDSVGHKVFEQVIATPAFRQNLLSARKDGSSHYSVIHVGNDGNAYLVSSQYLSNKKEAVILVQDVSKVFNRISPLASWYLIIEQRTEGEANYFEILRDKDNTVARAVSADAFDGILRSSRANVYDVVSVFGSSGRVYSVLRNSTKNELVMPWVVLACGMTITALLSLLVYSLINRNIQIQWLVQQKTIGLEIESTKAKEAAISKGKFVANMSHEVRTPLNLILGMADLLNETRLSSTQKEYVECFQRAGSHLMRLIDDVLDIVKSDLNDVKIRIQWINVVDLAEEITRFFEPLCLSKGLFFQCDVDPRLPKKFLSDPSRIRQIVINLLNNAIKFTENGYVRLTFAKSDREDAGVFPLLISVSDSGLGIPLAMKQSIFDEFVQVDDTSKRSRGGVGLGLSIVKALLKKLGGRIEVDSVENKGSVFSVQLQGRFENDVPWIKQLEGPQFGSSLYVCSEPFARPGLERVMPFISSGTAVVGIHDVKKYFAEHASSRFDLIVFEGYRDEQAEVFDLAKRSLNANGTILLVGSIDETIGAPVSAEVKICRPPLSTLHALKKLGFGNEFSKENERIRQNKAASESNWHEQLKGLKVIVAEDDASNRFLIEAYLRSYPLKVDYASNGKEALEIFAKGKHDIIVTDLHMPIMDGYELIRKVRYNEQFEQDKDTEAKMTPIIVLTADVQDASIKRVMESQNVSFIAKPVSKVQLLNAMQAAASGRFDDHEDSATNSGRSSSLEILSPGGDPKSSAQ